MLDYLEVNHILRAAGKGMTIPAIAAKMHRPAAAVRKAITRLRDEKRVEPVDVVVVTVADRKMTTRGYQLTKKGRRK